MRDNQRISARLRLSGRALSAVALAAFLAVAVTLSAAGAPPDNDNWANAITIAGASGSTTGTNVEATVEPSEPGTDSPLVAAGVVIEQTGWWRWVAPSSADVTFAVESGNTDAYPTLAVYTGSSVDSLSEVASDAGVDFGSGLRSRVFFSPDASTTYYIQVGAYEGSLGGPISLTWEPQAVPNDDFANATPLGSDSGLFEDYNVGATTETEEPPTDLGDLGSTVWYSWTPSVEGLGVLRLSTDFSSPTLGVYTGTNVTSLTEVAFATNAYLLRFDVAAGTTYRVQIGADDASPGTFALGWELVPRPDDDDLANASEIAGGLVSIDGSTVAATLEPSEPAEVAFDEDGDLVSHVGEQSVWYRWTPPASGPVDLRVAASLGDDVFHAPLLQLFEGPETDPSFGVLESLGTHDPDGYDTVDTLHALVEAGRTYYVQVMGDSTAAPATGFDFTLAVGFTNDDFADAATLAGDSGSIDGATVASSLEPGEPDPDEVLQDSVWYAWTPSEDGAAVISFDAALFASLAVYAGDGLNALTLVDNASDSSSLTVGFAAVGGTTYYVQAGTALDEVPGTFVLSYDLVSPPANDRLADAAAISGASGSVAGDTRDATVEEIEPVSVDVAGSPRSGGHTVWYRWVPPSSGPVAFTVTAHPDDLPHQPLIAVHRGPAATPTYGALVEAGTNDTAASAHLDAAAGDTYYVQVMADSIFDGSPSFDFTLAWASAPDAPPLTSATPGDGSVALAWTAPGANGSAITGYRVFRGTSSGGETLLATVGDVTGYTDSTAVNGTAYFYEVSAVNGIGEGARSNERSATPADPDVRDVAGTVRAANGAAVAGVAVRACLGAVCLDTTSDANGGFVFANVSPGVYVVRALPADPTLLAAQATADVTAQSVRTLDVRLATSGAGSSDAGPSAFRVTGCTGGTLHYVATADGAVLGSGDVADGAGSTPVDGSYTIDVTALGPGHPALLQLELTITCADVTETQTALLFADPSGTVVDDSAGGAALSGATVTLLDVAGNPIPAGDPRLSPATSSNPQTSDARGAWAWDVAPGTYLVRATKTDCGTATSGPLVVTPTNPVTNVVLQLACTTPAPPGIQPPLPPPSPATTLPDPVAGVSFNVVPISGTVLVNGAVLPGGQQIPFGAEIDATNGIVSITTIGPDGKPQTAFFYGGVFQLTLDPDGVTALVLKGGDFSVCGTKVAAKKKVTAGKRKTQALSATAKPSSKKVVRALWGTGKGSFRTKGRFSSATVRGTLWYHADRCDGTLTQVNEGTVTVLDAVRRKTLIVRAGHSVLVRPK